MLNADNAEKRALLCPAVEYDGFAALIKATKQRDAARKAKQQEAQLPAQPANASPDADAPVSTPSPQPGSDSPPHDDAQEQQAMLQPPHDNTASEAHVSHVDGHLPNGVHSQLAEHPAGPKSMAELQSDNGVQRSNGTHANGSISEQRSLSGEPELLHMLQDRTVLWTMNIIGC